MPQQGIDLDALARQYMHGAHSIFSASGSYGWINCSGYVLANLGLPDDAGEDAATGTVAHALAERWLKTGRKPIELLDKIEVIANQVGDEFWIKMDEQMFDHVWEYVRRCQEDDINGDAYTEQRVDFSRLTPIPFQQGTADRFTIQDHTLIFRDLKFGKGVRVFAEWNPQVILYALGVIFEWDWAYDIQDVIICVDQPRLDHFDEWHTTKAELLEYSGFIKERAFAAWIPDAPRTPTEAGCRFCKAKKTCAAYAAWIEKIPDALADDTFDDLDAPITGREMVSAAEALVSGNAMKRTLRPAYDLSTEALGKMLKFRSMIESYFTEVYEEAKRRVDVLGETIEGWQLKQGSARRRVTNERDAVARLVEYGLSKPDLYTKKLASVPTLETKLRAAGYKPKQIAEILSPVVIKPQGKVSLAPVKDPRPEAIDLADDTFEDLDSDL